LVEAALNRFLEAEITKHLQAGTYESSGARTGYRNGYRARRLKSHCRPAPLPAREAALLWVKFAPSLGLFGSRRIVDEFVDDHLSVNRKAVQRMMRLAGRSRPLGELTQPRRVEPRTHAHRAPSKHHRPHGRFRYDTPSAEAHLTGSTRLSERTFQHLESSPDVW